MRYARRRTNWNKRPDFGAERFGPSGSDNAGIAVGARKFTVNLTYVAAIGDINVWRTDLALNTWPEP